MVFPQEIELEVTEDPAHHYQFDLNGAGLAVITFSVRFLGWSIKNASSTTLASLDIYDGTDTTGKPVFPINLAANETSRENFTGRGIWFKNAVYINVTAQHVTGSIFYRHWVPR